MRAKGQEGDLFTNLDPTCHLASTLANIAREIPVLGRKLLLVKDGPSLYGSPSYREKAAPICKVPNLVGN